MAGEHVIQVEEADWQSKVMESGVPVLVDFWAEWCGPCRALAPVLEQVADEWAGQIQVAKVNIDNNPQIASQYGIRSIPTLLVIKGGEVQEQMVGAMNRSALEAKLQPYL